MYGVVYYFAQAYGDGAYNSSKYGCTQEQLDAGICVAGAGSGTGSGGAGGTGASGTRSGTLADTGLAIVAIVTLASLLMFVGLLVRIWRRPKLATQQVTPVSVEQVVVPNDQTHA